MKFCPKCGYFVNSNTSSCPKCGYNSPKKPISLSFRTKTGIGIASLIGLSLVIFLLIPPEETNDSSKYYGPFVQFALKEVNEDRKKHGVIPVSLGNNSAAQNHAGDLLQVNYFSHWNSNGVKPYVTYTLHGGKGYVAENIANTFSECPTLNCIPAIFDPYKEIERLHYGMMYDDAASNWGHRDTIIDPNHNYVNFGIAFDNDNFYFVQHFETILIEWSKIEIQKNKLKMIGKLPDDFSISHFEIFSDDAPKQLSGQELNQKSPYDQNYYDRGTLASMILEPPPTYSFYEECDIQKIMITDDLGNTECIYYEIYDNYSTLSNQIDISVEVSKWLELDDVHTLYVVLLNEHNEQIVATSITLEYLQ